MAASKGVVEISPEDRESIRQLFYSKAEELRKRYGLPIPTIRKKLREILEVSV